MLIIEKLRLVSPAAENENNVHPFYADSIRSLFGITIETEKAISPTRNRLILSSLLRDVLGEEQRSIDYFFDIRLQEELGSPSPQYELLFDTRLTTVTPICLHGVDLSIIKEGLSIAETMLIRERKALISISNLACADWQSKENEFACVLLVSSNGIPEGKIIMKGKVEMKQNTTLELLSDEMKRVVQFIRNYANGEEPICILVSGGLDSDVTARLCAEAVGIKRIRLVVVLQDDMEERHLANARNLAKDLGVPIDEVDLRGMNMKLIKAVESGNHELFDSNSLLDPNRAKCSLRTTLMSCYQDKGYLIAGTSNRTEVELGFFLPFGDNLAHFKPIAHLYKTQVVQLAKEVGCRPEVITQAPSAGFWTGQEDLTDLSYWIINKAPIMGKGRQFTDEEDKHMEKIRSSLTQESVDMALAAISCGINISEAVRLSGLSLECSDALLAITQAAKKWKNRPLLRKLDAR
jgi:NAD+ synthase